MKNKIIKNIFFILLFGLFLVVIAPMLWMLVTSLKDSHEIMRYPPTLFPQQFTLINFINLFKNSNFLIYLFNSLKVAILVVIFTDIIAIMGAYSLCRFNYRGKHAVIIISLFVYMVAPIMLVIPYYIVMRFVGIANTHIALITAHTAFCFPFALWLLKSYLQDIPVELEKAAMIDGASHGRAFLSVALPLATPGITAISIFVFILSWNDYIFARVLITGDKLKTIPVGIEDILNATVVDWGMLMAAGVIISIPVVIAFIIINKFLINKLGYSGIKA